MQIDYVKISCKEDVHICRTNFAKQMERNLHETTSQWKTYGKRLFSEDLEVRDVGPTLATPSHKEGIKKSLYLRWCKEFLIPSL
jgi:hypothetical protein